MKNSYIFLVFLSCLPLTTFGQESDIEFFKDNTFVLKAIVENNIEREIEPIYKVTYSEERGMIELLPVVLPDTGVLYLSLVFECLYENDLFTHDRFYSTINILENDYFKAVYSLQSFDLPTVCLNDFEANIFLGSFGFDFSNSIDAETPYTKINYSIDADKLGFQLASEAMATYRLIFKKVAVAGIEKQQLGPLVQITANQTHQTLRIEANTLTIVEVAVLDALGRRVLTKLDDFTNIDVSHLAKGTYFVLVHSDKGSIFKQIAIDLK